MKKVISLVLSVVMVISLIYTGMAIPVTADAVQKVLSEELEGYERAWVSDFQNGNGVTAPVPSTPGGMLIDDSNKFTFRAYKQPIVNSSYSQEAADTYSLNKKYFDFDINKNGSTSDASSIFLFERRHWYDGLMIYWDSADNLKITQRYTNASGNAANGITKTFNLVDYGTTTNTEFFNLKIRADFSANASDSSKRDAVIQIWINNIYADEFDLEATDMRNGLAIRRAGSVSWSLREPKYVDAETSGYRRVDLYDYATPNGGSNIGADGIVNFANNDAATSYITDFDKTYLDVDVKFKDTGRFQYQAFAKYLACFDMSFVNDSQFRLLAYTDYANNKLTQSLVTVTPSDYGISKSEYFNIKLRTDIVNNGTTDSVSVQFWIKDILVYEDTVTFNYGEGEHSKSKIITTSPKDVRSAADVDDVVSGYNRITADDFYSIDGTSLSSSGRSFPARIAGEYKKDADDLKRSYFDFDIKMPNGVNPFMVWPSKNKTDTSFYGDGEQIRFYLDGTTLKMMKVHGGGNGGTVNFGDISAEPYNYSSDEFCNFKIRTNYYGGNSIGLLIWVNDNFLAKVQITTYDADIMEDMTCAGFGGDTSKGQIVYVRTPDIEPCLGDTKPVFDSEEHIKTVNFSDSVSNGSLMNFDYYIEDLSAPVVTEYTVNGSYISANSSTVIALASVGEEEYFFGVCLTKSSGWNISLFDNNLDIIYNYGTSQNYPDTGNKSPGISDYKLTVKTENGAISFWINDSLVLKNYKEYRYGNCTPKVAVYSNASSVTLQIETWCEIDNYNLLGDFVPDLTIDILDLVRAEQVSENIEGLPKIGRYVKAFNNEGIVGSDELLLMTQYILGIVNTLESN